MAITKIRKISSWTMLIVSLISIVVFLIFAFGGVTNPGAEMTEPVYTGLLLNWTYALFAITIIAMLALALWHFSAQVKSNPKSALNAYLIIVGFVALFVITYAIGDATPISTLNADSQEFNTPMWLKVTDMWLYSSIILIVLIIIALIWGVIRKSLDR